MKRNTIRLIVLFASFSMIGIIIAQIYWVRKMYDLKEHEFNREVTLALKEVASTFFQYNEIEPPSENPVRQISSAYYVVMVNSPIDANLIEYLLKREFHAKDVLVDFEYGIYDCNTETMAYSDLITYRANPEFKPDRKLPVLKNDNYYFGVFFPGKTGYILEQLGIWAYSTIAVLVVIALFAYTVFELFKQKRLSEIQKDFINNMTHEFKTPISTISISAEVLKDPEILKSPERMLNYTTIIQNESQRLQNQVERVLQMASIDKSRIGLKKEEVNVHEIIDDAIDNIQPALSERQGKLQCQFNACDPTIKADRLHLTNIIFNLLDNAVKYCKINPRIGVETFSEKKGITIRIHDNGIGIDPDDQRKIFRKFFRVHTGNRHDVKGFGLGLNYVELIAKAHHGYVTVSSDTGEGSTFTIYLPYD